LELNCKKN